MASSVATSVNRSTYSRTSAQRCINVRKSAAERSVRVSANPKVFEAHAPLSSALKPLLAAGVALAVTLGSGSVQPVFAEDAQSVQKRIASADSLSGDGQPDKSDAALPETAGGGGGTGQRGGVPPAAGRSNLESTKAAPPKAQ